MAAFRLSAIEILGSALLHPLSGAIEKFNRAKEQFDELRAEMDQFFNTEPKPHFSLGDFDSDEWEWIERFQVRRAPPLRFGVILGDCVHNLRSSLDHVIWQVSMLDGGQPDAATQFPIASKSEAQFEAMAKSRIPGLSAKHRAVVKQAQPYTAGHAAASHPLAVLADLSNTDKHRIVNPTYSFVVGDAGERLDRLVESFKGPGSSPVHAFWLAKEGSRMEHGTPWFRMTWNRGVEPPHEVKMSGDLPLGITFGDIGLDASDFPRVAESVRRVTQTFLADFPETEFIDV